MVCFCVFGKVSSVLKMPVFPDLWAFLGWLVLDYLGLHGLGVVFLVFVFFCLVFLFFWGFCFVVGLLWGLFLLLFFFCFGGGVVLSFFLFW